MQPFTRLLLAITVLWLSACAQVPTSAIDLNRQVSTGISSLGTNGQEAVAAWEEAALAFIDDRWKEIYKKADSEFRIKRKLADNIALNGDQAEEVAGLAALIRDEARKKIIGKANEMRKVISDNTKATLEANESVTRLLVSANSVLTAQESTTKQVVEHAKLPATTNNFLRDLIKR